jgi:hypothetical protein
MWSCIKELFMGWGVAQVLGKYKILSSNPSTAKEGESG